MGHDLSMKNHEAMKKAQEEEVRIFSGKERVCE